MFKSTNGGVSWTRSDAGLRQAVVHRLAVDAGSSALVYCGHRRSLLAPGIFPRDLAFDPHTPGLVYAALLNGVGHSTDGGATWDVHGDGLPPGGVFRLALDPDAPRSSTPPPRGVG